MQDYFTDKTKYQTNAGWFSKNVYMTKPANKKLGVAYNQLQQIALAQKFISSQGDVILRVNNFQTTMANLVAERKQKIQKQPFANLKTNFPFLFDIKVLPQGFIWFLIAAQQDIAYTSMMKQLLQKATNQSVQAAQATTFLAAGQHAIIQSIKYQQHFMQTAFRYFKRSVENLETDTQANLFYKYTIGVFAGLKNYVLGKYGSTETVKKMEAALKKLTVYGQFIIDKQWIVANCMLVPVGDKRLYTSMRFPELAFHFENSYSNFFRIVQSQPYLIPEAKFNTQYLRGVLLRQMQRQKVEYYSAIKDGLQGKDGKEKKLFFQKTLSLKDDSERKQARKKILNKGVSQVGSTYQELQDIA